jgi:predicted phosphodiesterase
MRIITYSDLHLEFGSGWMLPPAVNGDVMILAGDIVTLKDYEPLDKILRKWKKPVLYVTGNHEYYTRRPMNEEDNRFKAWLEDRHPHVRLLLDEEVIIGVSISSAARCGRISMAVICTRWRPPALK